MYFIAVIITIVISARNALEEKQLKIPFIDVNCAIMDELYLNPNFKKYVDSIVNVPDSNMGTLELITKNIVQI